MKKNPICPNDKTYEEHLKKNESGKDVFDLSYYTDIEYGIEEKKDTKEVDVTQPLTYYQLYKLMVSPLYSFVVEGQPEGKPECNLKDSKIYLSRALETESDLSKKLKFQNSGIPSISYGIQHYSQNPRYVTVTEVMTNILNIAQGCIIDLQNDKYQLPEDDTPAVNNPSISETMPAAPAHIRFLEDFGYQQPLFDDAIRGCYQLANMHIENATAKIEPIERLIAKIKMTDIPPPQAPADTSSMTQDLVR